MEMNGLVEEISKYAEITGAEKIRLKLAIRKLRDGAAAADLEATNARHRKPKTAPGARWNVDDNFAFARSRHQVDRELVRKLANHIKLLENCESMLKNKENQINKNKQRSERIIDEICDSIICATNNKRKELKNKTHDVFVNDCARIKKDLSSVGRELTRCNKYKNDDSDVRQVEQEIGECLRYDIRNVRDFEYRMDKNGMDIVYDDRLIKSISKDIGLISVDIELNDSKDEEYIVAKEYCQNMATLLDKTSCFMEQKENQVKQLPSLKDTRMIFPQNLNAQNGCIALGKHVEIYDIANNKNITKEGLELFYKNKCYVGQEMNKKAIFGGRGKNIYLAIVTDIYDHVKIRKYNRLLLLTIDKYINKSKYKECNTKSLLYQFINEDNDANTLKQIRKGQSLLEHIRKGNYRLTNEELKFLQYGKMDVGKAVENVRSTRLLLKLKEFEQSQIPFIQEKKAMMAASNNDGKGNNVDVAKLMSTAQRLRQREEFEVGVMRQINKSGLRDIEQGIANNRIPFSKEFENHKDTMILCARCQMEMIKNKCIKGAIEACQSFALAKELRRIMICHADPKEKFGFYVCKFKYDTSCPKYCSELEYLTDAIDHRIETLQIQMLGM